MRRRTSTELLSVLQDDDKKSLMIECLGSYTALSLCIYFILNPVDGSLASNGPQKNTRKRRRINRIASREGGRRQWQCMECQFCQGARVPAPAPSSQLIYHWGFGSLNFRDTDANCRGVVRLHLLDGECMSAPPVLPMLQRPAASRLL